MKPVKILLTLITSLLLLVNSSLSAETVKDGGDPFRFADIFHYENPVKKGENVKKWDLNISGGFTKKDGNTNLTNSTYSTFLKYDDNLAEVKLNFSGSYGKFNRIVNENRGTATCNFDYYLFWRLEFFSYTMSDFNKITMLKHRNGTGAGAKIIFIKNSYLLMDLSGAPIFQYEKYEEESPRKNWRWSIRGRIDLFPSDNDFTVRYYIFYIPALEDRSNYRTIQDLYFYKKLAGSLGFKAGYRREYNTYDKKSFEENPLLKKTDSTIYTQVSLSI